MFTNYDISINLPNSLTTLRFLLTPFFLNFFYILFSSPEEKFFEISTLVLFLLICSTDILDGYAARKTGLITPFGAFFDVAGDFFFRFSSLALFSFLKLIPFWLPVIYLIFFLNFIFHHKIIRENSNKVKYPHLDRRGFLTPFWRDKNVLPIRGKAIYVIHDNKEIKNSFDIKIFRKTTPIIYAVFIGIITFNSSPTFTIFNHRGLYIISFYLFILTFIAILEGVIFPKRKMAENE